MIDRRLWLVRHGETDGQSSIRYHGSNDVSLSDVGRQQIRALAPLLAHVAFARVVHSPLSRAAESAAVLAGELGLDSAGLQADERLREISFGACEGMTRPEIERAFPGFFRDYEQGRIDAFPDGEPRAVFAARVGAAIDDLAAETWRGDLLVVAHRGTVKQAVSRLLCVDDAQDRAQAAAFGVELGSLTVLRQQGRDWQLELLGLRL